MYSRSSAPKPATASDNEDEAALERQLQEIKSKLDRKRRKITHDEAEKAVPSSPRRKQQRRAHDQTPSLNGYRDGPQTRRIDPSIQPQKSYGAAVELESRPAAKPHGGFNSRMAGLRRADKSQTAHQAKSQSARKSGFGAGRSVVHSEANDAPNDAPLSATDHDEHSGVDLSRRYIPAPTLDASLSDKAAYPLPRLLKEVTSPRYDPPDVDGDFVVFAIVASKSAPRAVAGSSGEEQKKFMALHLTDLRWEMDMFLFDGAFDNFWKICVGSVIAILNPTIMPPKRHMRDSGQFSLKVSSSDDCILEIGTAAHLGLCASVKRDGTACGAWFDSRSADHCEFHTSLAVERSRAGRMETNSMHGFGLFANNKKEKAKPRGHRRVPAGHGFYKDVEAQSHAFAIPSAGASTTALLDSESSARNAGVSAQDRRRKQLAARERDRDLGRLLNKGTPSEPSGTKTKGASSDDAVSSQPHAEALGLRELDAKALGLVGAGRGLSKSSSNATTTAGWGFHNRRGLPEKRTPHAVKRPRPAAVDAAARSTKRPQVEEEDDLLIV